MLHLSHPSFNNHHPQSRTLLNMSQSVIVDMTGASSMITSMNLGDQDGDMVDNETQQIIRPTVIIPFPAPKVMDLHMFQGDQKESLYWGTYRPQTYFGVGARDPDEPLVAGLMWRVTREGKPVMRHFCENKNDLKSFGWREHNGIDFGRQDLIENDLTLETSFVKTKEGSHGYGGDWAVRINVENLVWLDDEEKRGANLFFYIADEGRNKVLNLGLKESSTLVSGSHAKVGNWQLHLKSTTPDLETHYCGFKTPNSVELSKLVLDNLKESKPGRVELSDTAQDDSNVYVFQISTTAQFSTIDIVFISGITEETANVEKRVKALTGHALTSLLEEKYVAFDLKFKECFKLPGDIDYNTSMVGKTAIANMLGGIGYFHGHSKVHDHNSSEETNPLVWPYWPAELYTAVPCRPKFPWGFLWDEGFHQMLIWRWDFRITLEIVGHWLDLMNVEGWIPREQLLGAEALSKINPEYVVQDPDIANPPTLLLVLCELIIGVQNKKFNEAESGDIVLFLERALARLDAWFKWLYTSQKGKKEGSFYWRGRDSKTNLELNPRTLASGLDDYPRASHPSDDERHVDLRCWIYIAADCMKFITEFLTKKEEEKYYTSIVKKLSKFDDLNALHYDHDHETYLDYGNHTEKVRFVFEHGKLVRVTDEDPVPRKVPQVGYVSFFPFISKIIPPKSQILEQQLDLISNNNIVWSEYGLVSLAKTSSLYMQWNALHQLPYWRGPIWMNINYLILASLDHYSKLEGPYSNKARTIYMELRSNLISNVVRNYDQTDYIWEHYNQIEGTGEGGRNFTGWSALILLIMSEEYPRL
ncbi:unnamed protein product [Microthlaspi erraticum]|uniref:Mannosyl-oligosaccharide glucosidase n=1 Tax=Microthlaspi erraticum TaxID=1685480 RepID=A0A6D2KZA3_9BRAS|nr:unnamed protein product [Microthlaspi erraticum]